jgi:hypothetical protein
MSTKRILGIALFGVLFIITVFGVMLLTLFLKQESDAVALPDISPAVEIPSYIEPDTLDRVEVTKDTIQAVVSMTLSRPVMYSRDVVIKSFWEDGQAEYNISISVWNGMTSLRTLLPMGIEKRTIITPNQLYIWYKGDREPYIGNLSSSGDGYRNADEWQMLITYEDLLQLDKNDISEAGYIEYGGEECVYAVYRSPLLNYTRTFYISLNLGLVIGAEEVDESGKLVYSMTAGECIINEIDPSAFILPDGTNLK